MAAHAVVVVVIGSNPDLVRDHREGHEQARVARHLERREEELARAQLQEAHALKE